MAETPTNIIDEAKTLEPKDSVITKVRRKIHALLLEMRGKMQEKPEQEDGDDGFDPEKVPNKYIQAIDRGEDPE